ncbi:MFS transporter [Streptosporangium saharense]|uniref:MFS family permease n=1 Tax=Streptosporangium saharense TaxID=1706840 RepID=A0A7W7QN35_9ACTN|nr:MFS transporter [Streptosporangium saharense]MBB4916645.1 MFS family permease [Streptosporangium saharense]
MTSTVVEAPSGGLFAERYRALTVGMVALIVLVAFEALAVATAMPVVGRELDGIALYALAFSGALAAGMVATVLGGRWADLRGPVAPLWTGVAAFVAGLVIAGSAPTMDVFVLGRFVQGFGGGIFQVALYVLVSRVYPARLHPRVFSVLAAGWVVPSMVGPLVAGVVVEQVGWRWVFFGVPMFVLPAALLLWRGLSVTLTQDREQETGGRTPIARRLGWAALTAVGAALMQYGGAARGAGFVLLAAGLAVLALSLPRLLPPGTLRAARGLPSVIALRGIAAGTALGGEVFLPLMLTGERGLSPAMAGMVLTSGALAWAFASWLVGRGWFGRALILRAGPAMIALGIALMALTVFPEVPVALAVVGETIVGLGIGSVYPTLSVLVLELSKPGEEGENSASMGIGESVFTVVVVAVVGAIVAAFGATGPVYLACFALTALVALGGALVGNRFRT